MCVINFKWNIDIISNMVKITMVIITAIHYIPLTMAEQTLKLKKNVIQMNDESKVSLLKLFMW